MDDSKPSNLTEALAVTPLLHLVPLQETAALLVPFTVDMFRESPLGDLAAIEAADLEILDELAQELKDYTNEDLELVKFPAYSYMNENVEVGNKESHIKDLHPLEKLIVENSTVDSANFVLPSFHRHRSEYDSSRLSVRKTFDGVANEAHNLNYKKKFLKEYSPEKGIKRKLDELLDESDPLPSSSPPKISKMSDFEIVKEKLTSIMSIINEENYSDKYVWCSINEEQFVSSACLAEIFECLTKMVFDPKVGEIDSELIMKIQSLMFKTLSDSKNMNFVPYYSIFQTNNLTDDAVYTLYKSLSLPILSAKILMLILGGNFKERKIYLDEYLSVVVDFIYALQSEVILNLLKKLFKANVCQGYRPLISHLIDDIRFLFHGISTYASKYSLDEHMQTQLEYLTILTIQVDGLKNDSHSLIPSETLSNLKIDASDVLIEIFRSHPDQRMFILHELIMSMDKNSTSKSVLRNFKTLTGTKVLLLTVILVRMVESVVSDVVTEINLADTDSNNENVVEPQKKAATIISDFVFEVTSAIMTRFTEKVEFRVHLETLIEDLLLILLNSEWSGAESLVVGFMKSFLSVIQINTHKNIEPYLFDLLGKMAEKIVELKKDAGTLQPYNATELLEYQQKVTNLIYSLQSQVNRNPRYLSSLKFICLKFLIGIEKIKEDNNSAVEDLKTLSSVIEGGQQDSHLDAIIIQMQSFLVDVIRNGCQTPMDNINVDYSTLLLRGELPLLYDNFLNITLQTLESSKIKSKSKALRIFSTLIDKDLEILHSRKIQDSIALLLQDKSPLVRDAAIDFISKFVLTKPELSTNFYKPICGCLNDSSTLVKKRVIRLIKSMYLNLDNIKGKVYIATKILMSLYDEEDSIVDLVKIFLKDILIGSDVASDNVEILMEVVNLGGKVTKQFQEYIRSIVLSDSRDYSLNSIVNTALDQINDYSDNAKIEKGLKLISILVDCESKLITQEQLISLQPHLMDENSHGSVIYYNLIILKRALPEVGALRPDYAQSVQIFLIQNLTKFNIKEMNEAMPCIWYLCELQGNTDKLSNASISCMRMIKPYLDKQLVIHLDAKLEKLIHLLGCFGTYCRMEKHRELFINASLGFRNNESVVSVIMKYLLFFCEGERRIKNAAISNVINICIEHPKFFLSEPILKIFDSEFKTLDSTIIQSIITGLVKFLKLEEEYSQKRNEKDGVKKHQNLDLAVFHGNSKSSVTDGICAGLVQRYTKTILDLCVLDNGVLITSCLEYLQLVVQLGFSNPRVCIPTIIAFEANENPRIRRIAISLHKDLYEKHESLTDNSYVEGIKLGISFLKTTQSNILTNNEYFQCIYEIVSSAHSSRKKFVNSLAKLIRADDDITKDEATFVAQNIAFIKLTTLEECLILITKIDQILEEEGIEFYETFNSLDSDEIKQSQNIDDQIHRSKIFLAFLQLRQILVFNYGVDSIQIDNFRPTRVNSELKQPIKLSLDRKLFIQDVDNDGIDNIIQFLQGMKAYV